MKRVGGFVLLLLLIAVSALLFRGFALEDRPMHADEAVHALKFRDLWEKGQYRYDPNEFHGPTLYYAALPVVALHGRHTFAETRESDYRWVTVLFGVGLVLLPALLAKDIGRPAALAAAVLTALSPAFVFYSRYYIQETLLTFFTLGAIACGWRYYRNPAPGWAIGAGLCAGLIIATKETAVLAFVAALVAWMLAVRAPIAPRHLALAIGIGVAVAVLLLSSFLTNPVGPLDYLRSYTPWLRRAHATELHQHPWHYYLGILLGPSRGRVGLGFLEAPIVLLALIGASVGFWQWKSPLPNIAPELVRFLALYTLILTVAYSAIPYKTPWCVLSFLNGMILLAGIGSAALIHWVRGWFGKTLVGLLLAAGTGLLGWQSYRASYVAFADPRNPYVYSPTAPEVLDLSERLEALAGVHPDGNQLVVQVVSADAYYWPLPWYLRRFPNVGYWTELPSELTAPLILASPEYDIALTQRLAGTHQMTGFYGLRSGVLLQAWVRRDLWQSYLKTRSSITR